MISRISRNLEDFMHPGWSLDFFHQQFMNLEKDTSSSKYVKWSVSLVGFVGEIANNIIHTWKIQIWFYYAKGSCTKKWVHLKGNSTFWLYVEHLSNPKLWCLEGGERFYLFVGEKMLPSFSDPNPNQPQNRWDLPPWCHRFNDGRLTMLQLGKSIGKLGARLWTGTQAAEMIK